VINFVAQSVENTLITSGKQFSLEQPKRGMTNFSFILSPNHLLISPRDIKICLISLHYSSHSINICLSEDLLYLGVGHIPCISPFSL